MERDGRSPRGRGQSPGVLPLLGWLRFSARCGGRGRQDGLLVFPGGSGSGVECRWATDLLEHRVDEDKNQGDDAKAKDLCQVALNNMLHLKNKGCLVKTLAVASEWGLSPSYLGEWTQPTSSFIRLIHSDRLPKSTLSRKVASASSTSQLMPRKTRKRMLKVKPVVVERATPAVECKDMLMKERNLDKSIDPIE